MLVLRNVTQRTPTPPRWPRLRLSVVSFRLRLKPYFAIDPSRTDACFPLSRIFGGDNYSTRCKHSLALY